MYKYRAFGLNIASHFPIPQLIESDFVKPDVRIIPADQNGIQIPDQPVAHGDPTYIITKASTVMRVSGGCLVEVDVAKGDTDSYVAVYLMGSCMGAILVQRGFMLLHGSCVTNGERSILITGDSGAGKSTMAAEFLKHGWKLLTDDVTCVYDQGGVPMVQPSYPSQKLWQDAMDRYVKSGDDVHSLYFSEEREKFGVSVADSFCDQVTPLSMVVRLMPLDRPCYVGPIEGMAKVDQLLRNTYRYYMIEKQHQQRHFQRCVTLSTLLPMALAIREKGTQCAEELYTRIVDFMEEQYHD